MKRAPPDRTAAGYLETFSLRCEPFRNGIDSRFFYAGTALMQRLDLLTHLTQFGDSVILVSAPQGSGKTTLLSRFLAQSNPHWRLCPVDAAQFEQFTDRLADAIGEGSFANEQELISQWAGQSDSSQLLVIVIDNSEQLDEAALDHLGKLLSQAAAERIRLILFGPPEAQQRIKQAFDQKSLPFTTQLLEVPRLTEEETASYLMYRLAVAGYSGESPFTPTEVRAICKAADGRPADINRLADEALLERQARTTSRRIPLSGAMRKGNGLRWGLAAIAVVGVALYFGWQQVRPPAVEQDQLATRPPATPELPLALPEPAAPQETPVERLSVQTKTPAAPAEAEAPPPTPAVEDLVAPQPLAPAEPSAADGKTSVQPVIADARDSAGQAELDTAPRPDIAAEVPKAPEPQPAAETITADTPATQAMPPEERVAAAEPAQPPASYPHREAWLLEQAAESFSLQLLGSRSEKSMLEYIRRHGLNERETAYYRGIHQGAPWYVLLYGVYPTRQAALDGRNRLPEKVRRGKPWARDLASVHKAIKEVQ